MNRRLTKDELKCLRRPEMDHDVVGFEEYVNKLHGCESPDPFLPYKYLAGMKRKVYIPAKVPERVYYVKGKVLNITDTVVPGRMMYFVEIETLKYEELSGNPYSPVFRKHPYPLMPKQSLLCDPPKVGDTVFLCDKSDPHKGLFCSLTAVICDVERP